MVFCETKFIVIQEAEPGTQTEKIEHNTESMRPRPDTMYLHQIKYW